MQAQDIYEQSKQAARDGSTEEAERYLEQVVTADPGHVDAWLDLSGMSDDVQTSFNRVQRAAQAAPNDPRVVDAVRRLMLGVLERDAFIDYIAEDERRYVVSARAADVVTVPKVRETQEPFPPKQSTEGQRLLRMCLWMLIGLFSAGLVTLALCPLVARRALRLLQSHSAAALEVRRGELAFALSLTLSLVGVLLAGLLALHWVG